MQQVRQLALDTRLASSNDKNNVDRSIPSPAHNLVSVSRCHRPGYLIAASSAELIGSQLGRTDRSARQN